ncbi:MAG: hypothetical protein JRJ79_17150 [Deltaproteobacteria bacterium]|nr:hypothetical protein [Deltaproteobacteria bacterium]
MNFRIVIVQTDRLPEDGQVGGQIIPLLQFRFPKAVSGVASDKHGIDILQLPPEAIVSQKHISQEEHGIRFRHTAT